MSGVRPVTVCVVPVAVCPLDSTYPVTPTLSVDASHASDTDDAVVPVERRLPGTVGATVSGGPVGGSTSRRSRFGPPFAVVATVLIVLEPAFNETVVVRVCQVVHAPVPGNESSSAASEPFTETSIGRLAVVPLANRNASVAWPALGEVTVNSTELPTSLS